MPMTKEGNRSPDIIYTQTFHVAQAKYLGYTERKNAINPERDFELENNPRNDQIQIDPDEKFAGYIGYMDRKAATKLEYGVDDNRYPTFTRESLNIDDKQHQRLLDDLDLAQKNKTMLWAGVVSFSPEFIRETGLYDEKTKTVNQRAIKLAIQRAMPDFLAAEELDNDQTFWWGDVHLNTDHVHVHLAISQRENTRPLKNGEPVGMFRAKSLRKLKTIIHQELTHPLNREHDIGLDKEIAHIRKDMVENVQWLARHDNYQQKMLRDIYWSLPQYRDKRKWRSSNHSQGFKKSHELTDKLVDDLLKSQLADDYQKFRQAVHEKDVQSRKKYGQHIKDTEKRRDKALRDFLANRIYDYLREVDQEQEKNNHQVLEKIASQGVDENKRLLELEKEQLAKLNPASKEAQALRKRLGLRRLYLRQVNLTARADAINTQLAQIEKLDDTSPAKEYFVQVLKEQRELVKLKKMPKSERERRGLTNRYRELSRRYVDAKKLPIQSATPAVVKARIYQLAQEANVISKYPDSPAVQLMILDHHNTDSVQDTINHYQTQQEILKLKQQIYLNNRQYGRDFEKRNAVNRPLFKELKHKYVILDKGDQHDRMTVHRKEYLDQAQKDAQWKVQTKRGGFRILSKFDQLLTGLQRDGRREMNAMRKHLDDDDEIDRADREEERESREI